MSKSDSTFAVRREVIDAAMNTGKLQTKTDGKPNRQSPEERLQYLLDDLCVEWGFCIPSDDAARIAASNILDADEFAVAVLRAEGMVPEYEKKWRHLIKERFKERFGTSPAVRGHSDR